MHLCVTNVPHMTVVPLLVILYPIPFRMHLPVSALDCKTESSNGHCRFSNFLSTTSVLPRSFCLKSFFYETCVFNACICYRRYLKFICAGSTAWIVEHNKPISSVNSTIDTCIFWRNSSHCFWTFKTFFSGKDRVMINESTVTSRNSILCVGVNNDLFKFSTNPSCWRRKFAVSLAINVSSIAWPIKNMSSK